MRKRLPSGQSRQPDWNSQGENYNADAFRFFHFVLLHQAFSYPFFHDSFILFFVCVCMCVCVCACARPPARGCTSCFFFVLHFSYPTGLMDKNENVIALVGTSWQRLHQIRRNLYHSVCHTASNENTLSLPPPQPVYIRNSNTFSSYKIHWRVFYVSVIS